MVYYFFYKCNLCFSLLYLVLSTYLCSTLLFAPQCTLLFHCSADILLVSILVCFALNYHNTLYLSLLYSIFLLSTSWFQSAVLSSSPLHSLLYSHPLSSHPLSSSLLSFSLLYPTLLPFPTPVPYLLFYPLLPSALLSSPLLYSTLLYSGLFLLCSFLSSPSSSLHSSILLHSIQLCSIMCSGHVQSTLHYPTQLHSAPLGTTQLYLISLFPPCSCQVITIHTCKCKVSKLLPCSVVLNTGSL